MSILEVIKLHNQKSGLNKTKTRILEALNNHKDDLLIRVLIDTSHIHEHTLNRV